MPALAPRRARLSIAARVATAALALTLAAHTLPGTGLARSGPQSVAPLAERLQDAVVNISTSQAAKSPRTGVPLPTVPKGSPFEQLFEDYFQRRGPGERDRKVSSLGSGFVIDGVEGLIVTNNHVIDGADEIVINFANGTKLKVDRVIGRDTKTDLALLKVTPKKPLKSVKFGSSAAMKVGDWVMAIGNPFGLGGSVTVGIISAKQRDIASGPYDDYLQTDASINKGNSGGPLFNMDGDVIGVNTAIISPTGGSIGIGFAVPSDTAMAVIEQLRQFGETRRGWLGARIQTVTEDIAESLGVPENTGALVATVQPDSPASKGGIAPGDVILSFDGRPITSSRALPRLVSQTAIGKSVDVEILRNGQRRIVKVTIARLIEETPKAPAPESRSDVPRLPGVTLAELDDALRRRFGHDAKAKGLIVTAVEADSPSARRGLKAGELIVEAGQEKVATMADLAKAIEKVRGSGRKVILVRLEDGKGETRFVALPIE